MYTAIEQTVVFSGTPTTPEERKLLRNIGFVHVTGLQTYALPNWEPEYIIGEKLESADLGKWDYNNGICVVVTTGGEVWISVGTATPTHRHPFLAPAELLPFAPNGKGAFVPLSSSETLAWRNILERVADPNCGITYKPQG